MERSTAKTMDCYVEMDTPYDVEVALQRHENLVACGQHPKLGTRHVSLEVSSQDELLADLFPRAKSLVWKGGMPIKLENTDPYSDGFSGFFTREEMVGLVRHAENPNRSPFCHKCLQRTYECMISTLYKMPWFATDLYTLGARNMLFDTYMSQLRILVERVEDNSTVGLNQNLLRELIFAGVNCPAFGERQKFAIVAVGAFWGGGVKLSDVSCLWPFEVVGLRKEKGVTDDIVRSYLHLVEQGVQEFMEQYDYNKDGPSPFPYAEVITFRLPFDQPHNAPMSINNTHFCFTEAANDWPYSSVLSAEMDLASLLLESGWMRWQLKQLGISVLTIRTKPESRKVIPNKMQVARHKPAHESDDEDWGEADESPNDFGGGPSDISRTPEGSTSPIAPASSQESPKDTLAPDFFAHASTPFRPIASHASMSAHQAPVSKINPSSIPFRPRRQQSEPAILTLAGAPEGTLGFGLGNLGNGSLSNITALSRNRASTARVENVGAEEDGSVFESADPTLPMVPRAISAGLTSFALPPRRSAAVEIKNPDGSPALLDYNRASIRDESEPATRRSGIAKNDDIFTTLSPPKAPPAMRRRSDSGPGPGGQNRSFNIVIGSTPTKTPNRRLINIASTIHEESEGESNFGNTIGEDSKDEVIISDGHFSNSPLMLDL